MTLGAAGGAGRGVEVEGGAVDEKNLASRTRLREPHEAAGRHARFNVPRIVSQRLTKKN